MSHLHKRKLKIVHLFGHGYGGGFVLNQVVTLQAKGHEMLVVCPEEGPLTQQLCRHNIPVKVIAFGGSRFRDLPRIIRALLQLTMLLRYIKPDIVHCHLIKAMLVGRIASFIARVPVRISQLGGPLPLEIALFRYLDLATAWIDHIIIASSKEIKKIYEKYPHTRKKVVLNYYGFPLKPFLVDVNISATKTEFGIGKGEKVVGMIAYMYSSKLKRFQKVGIKGHEIFIQAAKYIVKKDSGVKFLIVGDEIFGNGSYRNKLQALARDIGLSDKIIFTGYQSNVAKLIAIMDVVAVPSLSENAGGAVEPLLMRKLVVASNVGGLPDVVIDGQTGRLVPPGDAQALAAATLQLLALSESEKQRMGQNGREKIMELFDLQKTVNQLESIYCEYYEGKSDS